MRQDPLRHLTRGLSEAVPHDPAFMAMTEGNGIIPTTWGDLASRLVEADVVEPTSDAVCDFLLIEPSQLSDPSIIFTDSGDVYQFESHLTKKYEDNYRTEHGEAAKSDAEKIQALFEQWKIEGGKEAATKLNEEIADDEKVLQGHKDETYWEARTELMLNVIKRNALDSGYCVGLDDFVSAVLSTESLNYFQISDIADAAESMIETLFGRASLDKDVPVSEVFIGGVQIRDFMQTLFWKYSSTMSKEVRRRWELLEPFIYAGHIYDHPLLAGNEQ